MRLWLMLVLIFVLATETADARRRHRHYRAYVIENPGTVGAIPYEDRRAMKPFDDRRFDDRRATSRATSRTSRSVASLAPDNWRPQPDDPNWNGKRFVSPDGASWFAVYRAPVADRPVSEHMKSVIFADGETITYLRGDRSWVAVSGFKETRVYYRKAILACAGKSWHHIAFEYPIEQKPRMDGLVASAAQALDDTQADCDDTISANQR